MRGNTRRGGSVLLYFTTMLGFSQKDVGAQATAEASPGPDGIPELNIVPGDGDWQLAPGNFGTVDIGGGDNSASDLARQISEGISAEDLAYHGGKLELEEDGYVDLNGDTGISAGVKDELEAIKGRARAIPIFSIA